METTRTIAKINGVQIQIVENGEKRVPIKPICEALGIDVDSQRKKIQSDEILSSVAVLSTATGSDGKTYDMLTIPYMFVFGWLFTINSKNVSPDAQESVRKYKLECYTILYNHFTEQSRFLDEQKEMLNIELDKLKQIKQNFKETKDELLIQQKKVDVIRHITFEEWKENNRQIKIPFID